MFPTTCATSASLSEPARVGDRHTMLARSLSVGIPSKAIGLPGIMFATLGVSPAGCSGPKPYHPSPNVTSIRSDQISRSVGSDSATPWITALQASLSITNSRSSLRLTSIESVMPSSHLILCRPIFLLPLIPPSISTPLLWNIWFIASYQFVLKPITNSYNQDPAPLWATLLHPAYY